MKKSTAEKLSIAIVTIALIGIIALYFITQFYPHFFARVVALAIALVFFIFSLAALAVPVWITYTIYVPSSTDDLSRGSLMESGSHFLGGLALVLFFGLMIASGGPGVIPGFRQVTRPMICPVGFEESRSQLVIRQYDYPGMLLGVGNTATCSGELGDHEVSSGIRVLGGFLAYLIYCGLYFAVVFIVRKQKLFAQRPYAAQGIILALFIALLSVTLLNPPVRAAIARPINDLFYRGHAVSLVEAVKRHKIDMIRDLLARGGDIYAKNNKNETAFETAQRTKSKEAMALFVDRVAGGSAEMKALLDRGIVYSTESFKEQVHAGNAENVRLFLDAGMAVDTDLSYKTALLIAVEEGHHDLARFLLGRKADVNKPTDFWMLTPLIEAAKASSRNGVCRDDIVRLLLESGADVKAKTKTDETALTEGAEAGCLSVVQALVEHNADINAQNEKGYSALLYAVQRTKYNWKHYSTRSVEVLDRESYDLVKYLLEHGADPNVKIDKWGGYPTTPLSLARQRRAKEVVELLKQYNARD